MTFAHADWAENWTYDPGFTTGQGSAHAVSGEAPDHDPVQALRDVVAEVTGKPVEAPPKPRMGFL